MAHNGILFGRPTVVDVRVLALLFIVWLRSDVHNVFSVFLLIPIFRILRILFRITYFSQSFPPDFQVPSGTSMLPAFVIISVTWPVVKTFGDPCATAITVLY